MIMQVGAPLPLPEYPRLLPLPGFTFSQLAHLPFEWPLARPCLKALVGDTWTLQLRQGDFFLLAELLFVRYAPVSVS